MNEIKRKEHILKGFELYRLELAKQEMRGTNPQSPIKVNRTGPKA